MNRVECVGCYGTGVDESGECVMLCPLCKGTGSLEWSQVLRWGIEHQYPAKVQLEQGTLVVREAITTIGGQP